MLILQEWVKSQLNQEEVLIGLVCLRIYDKN